MAIRGTQVQIISRNGTVIIRMNSLPVCTCMLQFKRCWIRHTQ